MILIAAGHHPNKPGLVYKGLAEHDEAVRWRDEVVRQNPELFLAVPSGVMREKMAFIKARSPEAAIEIHFSGEGDGEGMSVAFRPECQESMRLASKIHGSLSSIMPPREPPYEGWYRRDQLRGPDFFLAHCDCPAVLVIPGTLADRPPASMRAALAAALAAALGVGPRP